MAVKVKYGIRLNGKIAVLDPVSGKVIPPVSILLQGLYDTDTEATKVMNRVKDTNHIYDNTSVVVEKVVITHSVEVNE